MHDIRFDSGIRVEQESRDGSRERRPASAAATRLRLRLADELCARETSELKVGDHEANGDVELNRCEVGGERFCEVGESNARALRRASEREQDQCEKQAWSQK